MKQVNKRMFKITGIKTNSIQMISKKKPEYIKIIYF